MSGADYKVYFNAVSTDHGDHILAVGWVLLSGYQPVLQRKGDTSCFRFYLEKSDDIPTTIIKPFHVCENIPNGARSVSVTVGNADFQIQVHKLSSAESDANTAGTWVKV